MDNQKNISYENLKLFKNNLDNTIPKRVTLTQSEYDLLPDEDIYSDVVYFISDDVTSKIMYKNINYSVENNNEIKIDTQLSKDSKNPVQNKVITESLETKLSKDDITDLIAHVSNKNNPHEISKGDIGLDNVENTADNNKSVASAARLTTVRTINDTPFDGTSNIRIANAWNLVLGSTENTSNYCIFARMAKTNPVGNFGGTFIITDLGDYGGTLPGVWLVQITNRESTPTMNVTTLRSNNKGVVTFGHYIDGEYMYFGVYTQRYRASGNITILRNTGVTFQKFSNATTAPSGWTTVTVRTLQDVNTTYSAVSSTSNGLATPDLLSKATNALPKSGGTMTGALVGQPNTDYTTAQFRNITMSTSAPSGGSNGQVHFQYS